MVPPSARTTEAGRAMPREALLLLADAGEGNEAESAWLTGGLSARQGVPGNERGTRLFPAANETLSTRGVSCFEISDPVTGLFVRLLLALLVALFHPVDLL